jgi:hypothetical protein
MNTVDKISKEVISLTEYAKDVVKNNLTSGPLKGQFKLEDNQISSLLQLIDVSITSGIQKGLPNLQKSIKKIIEESSTNTKK